MEYKSRNIVNIFLFYEIEWMVEEVQDGDDSEWSVGI